MVWFKSYENFFQKTSTSQNGAQQSLATIWHTNGWTMLKKSAQFYPNIPCGSIVMSRLKCSGNPRQSKKALTFTSGKIMLTCIFII